MTQSQPNEMIERMARVLADRNKAGSGGDWPYYVDDARAVLTALREPTPGMIEAGERAAWDDHNYMPAFSAASATWVGMIDHILTEREG